MTENNGIQEIKKREFFVKKFVPKLEEWKKNNKDKGGTQKAFAKMVGVSEDMIKAYKSGVYPREKTLENIKRVLGVPDDYFTPTTEKELYEFSQGYMTDVGENKLLPYCEEIGLDPQFLVIISSLIGEDLGDQFPFWTPIDRTREVFPEECQFFKHIDPMIFWSNSAQMAPEVEMFQIEVKNKNDDTKENKLLTLSFPDLRFLRDVQDEVRDYVEFLFLKRKKELKREGEEASRRALVPLSGGGKGFKGVSPEDLNEIDKYFSNYVEKIPNSNERREKDGND